MSIGTLPRPKPLRPLCFKPTVTSRSAIYDKLLNRYRFTVIDPDQVIAIFHPYKIYFKGRMEPHMIEYYTYVFVCLTHVGFRLLTGIVKLSPEYSFLL